MTMSQPASSMTRGRMEAFSDGVIAIIITIMVIEMHVPSGAEHLGDLKPMIPVISSYVLSFTYLGIYWNNHHHLLHTVRSVSGGILWANLHLLFWLSLVPFVTSWIGQSGFIATSMALYGVVLLMAAIAYWILQNRIIAAHGQDSVLGRAIGSDFKGNISPILYTTAIALSFVSSWVAGGLYVLVALIWLIPDRRIERALARES